MRGARRKGSADETPQIRHTLRDFGWTPPGESARPATGTPSPGPGRHRNRRHRGRRIAVVVAAALAVAVPAAGGVGWHWVRQHPASVVGTALGVDDGRGTPDRASRGGARTTASDSASPSGSARPSSPSHRPSASGSPSHRAASPTRSTGSGDTSGSGSGSGSGGESTSRAGRYEHEVLTEINAARAKAGCGALRYDERLARASRAHSADMAAHDYFDHTAPNGSTPWDRAKAAGYRKPSAENIAAGQRTPHDAVQAWLQSSGHRANILNCSSHATGIGFARGGSFGYYWTELFGYA